MRKHVEYHVRDMGELHSVHKRRDVAIRKANQQAKLSHDPKSVYVTRMTFVTLPGDHVLPGSEPTKPPRVWIGHCPINHLFG